MNLITQRDLIRAVAKRWRETYEPFTDDQPLFSWRTGQTSPPLNKQQIAEKLDALDPETATAEEVNAAIGNESWVRLSCDECGKETEALVTVGQAPDYESHTASICHTCVQKLVQLPWPDSP